MFEIDLWSLQWVWDRCFLTQKCLRVIYSVWEMFEIDLSRSEMCLRLICGVWKESQTFLGHHRSISNTFHATRVKTRVYELVDFRGWGASNGTGVFVGLHIANACSDGSTRVHEHYKSKRALRTYRAKSIGKLSSYATFSTAVLWYLVLTLQEFY